MANWTANPAFGTNGPGTGMAAITLDAEISPPARRLYITGAGNLTCTGFDGVDFTIAVPSNFVLDVAVSKVKTGTSATGVFAIF